MITINVKVYPGSQIEDVAEEMCKLATRMNISVESKFNDVNLMAEPNSKPAQMVGEYYLNMSGDNKTSHAFARTKK